MFQKMESDKNAIQEFEGLCGDGPILEIGAGTGRTLGFIKNHECVMLEKDERMFAILAEEAKSFPNVEILEGDSRALPFEKEYFSGVYLAFATIGELNPICVTLGEIHRVLRDDGKLFLFGMNPESFVPSHLGIFRAKELKLKDFSVVSNTFTIRDQGMGEAQTHLSVKVPGASSHFSVSQYFPTIDQWKILLDELGFEPLNSLDSQHGSGIISIIAKKRMGAKIYANQKQQSGVSQVYDSLSLSYESFTKDSNYGVPRWLSAQLAEYRGMHPLIVDLACGVGLVGKLIEVEDVKPNFLYGYDISQGMVERCRELSVYNSVVRFDISKGLPGIGALRVDVVTAFGLMEFVADCEPILYEIRRVLCLGGVALLTFELSDSEAGSTVQELRFGDASVKRYARPQHEIESLISKIGFDIISATKELGYRSPTTGAEVNYLYVKAKRTEL